MCFSVGCISLGNLLSIIFVSLSFGAEPRWTPIGPEGGFLLSFAIAPSSPNVLYAGGDVYGGIYKSTDGGQNWEFMGMLSDLAQILDIKIHPDSSDIVYAACGSGGLYKTIDGGLNWSQVFKREDVVYSVGIDPNFPNHIYAGLVIDTFVDYALYKSTNGGATWSDSSFLGNPVLYITFDPDSLNTVYVGTSAGVFRSTDGGSIWNSCGPPSPSVTVYSLVVVDFNTFYVGTYPDTRDTGAVYKTTDGGATWDTSYVLGTTAWSLAVDPDSSNILYMAAGSNMFGLEGVYKTTDGGDTWFPANNGLVDRMATEIKIDPISPNIIYVTTDGLGGVYKSTDRATSWTGITSGMQYTPCQAMCFDTSNTLYAAVGYGTYRTMPCIFKTSDGGISWDTIATIPSPYYMTSIWDMVAYPGSSDVIYVGGMSHYSNTVEEPTKGFLYRSNNGGANWEELWTPDSICISCLAIDSNSGNIYAGTGGGDTSRIYKVYRSTDSGNNWEETSGWAYKGNPILELLIDPVSPNILYAGTGGIIYKSTNFGANWVLKDIVPCVFTFLIDPDSTNIIYAGSGGPYMDSGGVYKSINAGETWSRIGLGEYSITSLVGNFGSFDTLYAGTGGKFLETTGNGIFRSIDNGISWDSVNLGLTAPFVLSMAIDPISSNIIYAGTMGGGIFKYTEEEGIEERAKCKVQSAKLEAYPNPFAQKTVIEFRVQSSELKDTQLQIYDLTGRLVRSFQITNYQSPITKVVWDGRDDLGKRLGAGIYFYKLNVGEFSQTKKLLLFQP
ncbi:MAG: T9SS type A sorting domain-containing protein [Candidatus Stahlbacteria bacterium]|nr:T9SS type A sorting domain-containing protein [Candidatus Stahlbacteria bacterium]